MIQRDEAYVLRTQALGEADLIVSLFAENHGKVRGVARSARRSRKRFGGVLEPLTHVQVIWVEKAGRELHRIESVDAVRSYAAMQAEPTLQAVCAVLAEVSDVFAHEGEADPRTFRLLGAVLQALEGDIDPWIALRYFEYWMLRLHGLLPDVGACAVCQRPLPADRAVRVARGVGLRCRACEQDAPDPGRAFGAAERRLLEQLRRRPPHELRIDVRTARARGAVEQLLRGSLEAFVERPFRTYRHLNALAGHGDAS